MKKFASFVPVIGIFLVYYFLLIKKEDSETIWPNGFYYLGSAAFQAVTIGSMLIVIFG